MSKKLTLKSIKALNPCQDRLDNFIEHYPEFKGTLEEFFELNHITIHDKLWLGLRLLNRISVEVFSIDCAATAYAYAYADADATVSYSTASYAAAEASYAAAEASCAASASVATAASYTAAEASYAASVASADDVAAYTAAADEKKRQLDAILYLYNLEVGND